MESEFPWLAQELHYLCTGVNLIAQHPQALGWQEDPDTEDHQGCSPGLTKQDHHWHNSYHFFCMKAVPICFFLASTSQRLLLTRASLQWCIQHLSLKQLHRLWAIHHVNNNFSPMDHNGLGKHTAEVCFSAEEHLFTWAHKNKNKQQLLSLPIPCLRNMKVLCPTPASKHYTTSIPWKEG